MDLTFAPKKRSRFTIQVGMFDSVLEVKQKIEKLQGIPVTEQTLVFQGKELPDDVYIASCQFCHAAVVDLFIASDDGDMVLFDLLQKSPIDLIFVGDDNPPLTTEVELRVNNSVPQRSSVRIVMDRNEKVSSLKKAILELDFNLASINRPLLLLYNGQEMQDSRTLGECEVPHGAEIDVSLGPSSSGKDLEVIIVSNCGTMRVPVAVNSSDTVRVLREELENLIKRGLNFDLPPSGSYFFVHKEEMMDDDKPFQSHDVGQRDSIHIFPPILESFESQHGPLLDIDDI